MTAQASEPRQPLPEPLREQLVAALAALLVADFERCPVRQHDEPAGAAR
jgi:hypothetical protein